MTKSTKIFIGIAAAIVVITIIVLVFIKTKTSATEEKTTTNGKTTTTKPTKPTTSESDTAKTEAEILAAAEAVIRGEYGDYPERKTALEAEGFIYEEVQAVVNQLLEDSE